MGTGDYICVTMSGGAPWGFRLQGGKELNETLHVSKVRSMSKASDAGLFVGDEVVAINGTPCTDVPYAEVVKLIDRAADNLQFLIKRSLNKTMEAECKNGEDEKVEYKESTTLEIRPAPENNLPEGQEIPETFYARTDSDTDFVVNNKNKELLQFHKITPKIINTSMSGVTCEVPQVGTTEDGRQGAMVELQLSLPQDMILGTGVPIVTVLGGGKIKSSEKEEGEQKKEKEEGEQKNDTVSISEVCFSQIQAPVQQSSTTFQILGRQETKVIPTAKTEDPSFPRVELILDCSGTEKEEPRSLSDRGCVESVEEGGQSEAPPAAVSFGITAEDSEQEDDQQAEKDPTKPHKHRARHARLRRSESLSEKQVKEAKSKCKSIALLLTDAPNPRSKGVLMFKKRRQRSKKYTLISYGTGELERQEYEDDENEDDADKENTYQVTFFGASESDLDEDFLSDPDNEAQIVTFDWDSGILEVEKKLKSGEEMEELPETKGKGVLMFARRKQRMEQISAEQEELKRHSVEEKVAMTENIKNSVSYQSQERETIKTQSCVSKSYIEVSNSQGRIQNGIAGTHESNASFQSSEIQSSGLNRTAKPFGGIQNRAAVAFTANRNIASPLSDTPAPPPYSSVTPPPEPMYHVSSPVPGKAQGAVWSPSWPNEQIASRDERIAVPANRTGILQDAKRRSTGKPLFTFKEQPKVSPNPELLSLVQNREGKRGTGAGNESGPEEDYLSLGAEACNFMQAQLGKQKTPPPVAPKPSVKSPTTVTPVAAVWSPPKAAAPQPQVFPSQNVVQNTEPAQVSFAQPAFHSYKPVSLNLSVPPKASPAASGSNQTYTPKTPPTTPLGSGVPGGAGPAYEMPALRGKGAELFAKRQSRMEKYVVDSATVQAHAARPISPTPSLPSSWKYSSNVRAPPPLAYNPIQSPLYPLAANKSSKAGTPASKNTKKKPTKALSSLEVMKHQPYQLNSSLFTFQAPSDATPDTAAPKQNVKFNSLPPTKQAQSMKPVNAQSNTNYQPETAYSQPSYSTQPSFQSSVFIPNESSSPVGYPMYPRQESPIAALIPPPRPKFSAKKAGVAAQKRDNGRSLSIPGRSVSSGCLQHFASPPSSLLFEPSPTYTGKQATTPETPGKRLTPWEAAAKSPLGSVDDAFMSQSIHESVSANVVSAAARRKTLPGPPAAWKSTSNMVPAPGSYPFKGISEKKPTAFVPKSVVSAPSLQCGYQVRYPYSNQHSITDSGAVPLETRSEYCMSAGRDTNFNAFPRAWRR
ncbi:synaptopodin-2 [Discoglossus pictus]